MENPAKITIVGMSKRMYKPRMGNYSVNPSWAGKTSISSLMAPTPQSGTSLGGFLIFAEIHSHNVKNTPVIAFDASVGGIMV